MYTVVSGSSFLDPIVESSSLSQSESESELLATDSQPVSQSASQLLRDNFTFTLLYFYISSKISAKHNSRRCVQWL